MQPSSRVIELSTINWASLLPCRADAKAGPLDLEWDESADAYVMADLETLALELVETFRHVYG